MFFYLPFAIRKVFSKPDFYQLVLSVSILLARRRRFFHFLERFFILSPLHFQTMFTDFSEIQTKLRMTKFKIRNLRKIVFKTLRIIIRK